MTTFRRILTIGLSILIGVFIAAPVFSQNETAESMFDLGEIVITGTRTPHMLEDAPVQTRVITREDIEKSGVQKIADLLRSIPGVRISGGAPGAVSSRSTPLLRGLPSHYTLVLVDGVRMKSEHIHTGVNLNLMPVEQIERIEIVEGPASSLYGGDAMGGVVNIITRAEGDRGGSFVVTTGNNESTRQSLSGRIALGESKNLISFTRADSNGAAAQWFWRNNFIWKSTVSSSGARRFNLNYDLYLGDSYKGDDSKQDIALEYIAKRRDDSSLAFKLSESQYSNYKPTNNDASAAQVNFSKPLNDRHLLSAGMEYRREDFERQAAPRNKQTIAGFYLQDEMAPSKRLSVVTAFRVEKITDIDTEINPNVSALYDLSDVSRLRLSAARGFRAPSLQDLFEDHYNHGTYMRDGNPDLEPEKSTSYSLGYERSFSKKALWRLSFHRDNFTDMIAVQDTGMVYSSTDGSDYAACPPGHSCLPVRRRENISRAFSQGITTEIRLALSKSLSINLGYSYLKTEDRDTGRQLDYTPENTYTFMIGRTRGPWNLNLRGEGATDRVFKYTKTGVYADMDSYFTLGGNLSYTVNDDSELFFNIENMFNELYETFEEGAQPAQYGRSYYFGFKRDI